MIIKDGTLAFVKHDIVYYTGNCPHVLKKGAVCVFLRIVSSRFLKDEFYCIILVDGIIHKFSTNKITQQFLFDVNDV